MPLTFLVSLFLSFPGIHNQDHHFSGWCYREVNLDLVCFLGAFAFVLGGVTDGNLFRWGLCFCLK